MANILLATYYLCVHAQSLDPHYRASCTPQLSERSCNIALILWTAEKITRNDHTRSFAGLSWDTVADCYPNPILTQNGSGASAVLVIQSLNAPGS